MTVLILVEQNDWQIQDHYMRYTYSTLNIHHMYTQAHIYALNTPITKPAVMSQDVRGADKPSSRTHTAPLPLPGN